MTGTIWNLNKPAGLTDVEILQNHNNLQLHVSNLLETIDKAINAWKCLMR